MSVTEEQMKRLEAEMGGVSFMHTQQGSMLEAERERATFRTEGLAHLLDGGPEATDRRRGIRAAIEQGDPELFDSGGRIFQTRRQRYERALRKFKKAEEIVRGMKGGRAGEGLRNMMWVTAVPFLDDFPIALHCLMFMPNLKVLCTEKQLARWLPPSEAFQVIGCYAQTELGHGSNVRGLETTATFLSDSDEFEINTPSLSALKWWPGSLGCTANTAMVFARMLLHGKDFGVHNFIVPIRDLETHKLLPGVMAGEIGPKIGYNNMDNGWCKFDRVRIPRENMPMRFASVTREGKFVKNDKVHEKVGYVTMMEVRALMIADCRGCLAKACTIAVRYSAVRLQGGGKKLETKILDYPTQQHRLFPLVATCYAFHFTGLRMMALLDTLRKDVPKGDTTGLGPAHATLCGLKAWCTTVCSDGIEECRRCCGGHGYLQSSGLPELLGYALHYITAEGDSYVLAQQASRYLLKALAMARAEDASLLVGDCEYLKDARSLLVAKCQARHASEMLSLDMCVETHRHRVAGLLAALGARIEMLMDGGMQPEQAWMEVQVDQHDAALAHALSTLVSNFADAVREVPTGAMQDVLQRCAILFALNNMERSIGDFLESGYLTMEQAPMVRGAVRALLSSIRPDIVALVEAFDLSDIALASAIGSRSGEAYKGLLAAARRSEAEGASTCFEGLKEACLKPLAKL